MDWLKTLFSKEFFRYLLVGGFAFLVDFSLLTLSREFLFSQLQSGLYLSTALGFIAGLVVNYVLSVKYVFTAAVREKKGKNLRGFVLFTCTGVAGLLLTELIMYIGADAMGLFYPAVKIFATAAVLLFNYISRKLLIF